MRGLLHVVRVVGRRAVGEGVETARHAPARAGRAAPALLVAALLANFGCGYQTGGKGELLPKTLHTIASRRSRTDHDEIQADRPAAARDRARIQHAHALSRGGRPGGGRRGAEGEITGSIRRRR